VGVKVHIVCLDAPSPPDYGGAMEMFHKIKALAEAGTKITLHYFDYKRERNTNGLEQYCEKIIAYKRKPVLNAATFSKPHIVASRINKQLIEQLNTDDHPILLEGIHGTGIIPFLKNRHRKIAVRLHNDEAVYYRHLAKTETNFFKKSYYAIESFLLKQHQQTLPQQALCLAITTADANAFKATYRLNHVFVLPPFLPWQQVSSQPGSGTYCLYHGNMSVAENEATAIWLIQQVFSTSLVPFVIAGKNISKTLQKAAAPFQNIRLQSNPAEDELNELIQQAHIHVVPDFNATGVKLKLLHALFCGRFCITNSRAVACNSTIAFAKTPQDYMGFIKSFINQRFSEAAVAEREGALRQYNNNENARLLSAYLS